MARQGLAALVGGFQESREFVSQQKRDKQIRELFGRENVRLENQEGAAERMYPDEFSRYQEPQSWLQKFVGSFGRGQSQTPPMQALQTPPDPGYAERTQEQPGMEGLPNQRFEHGGSVRQMRKKYKHGGKALEEDDRPANGEWLEGTDLSRSTGEYFKGTAKAARGADALFEAAHKKVSEAKGPAETGKALREVGTAYLTGGLETIGAVAKDLTWNNPAIGGVAKGALGFVEGAIEGSGYGQGRDDVGAAVQGIPTEQPPEEAAAGVATQPTGGGAAGGAGGGQPQQAVPTTEGQDEREIDFTTEAREVMPEDLPAHSSKDWEDERKYWAAYAITQGQDPFAAMEKVDAQQTNGFARYSMQATALIDAGDLEGATRALYAAYQYFPNGKDVKFGVQTGKDGNRVIVAMGKEEESGKSSGPPQILDQNSISRMVENMKKPGALRAWTTDWQATEQKLWEQGFERDKLKETGRHNRAMEGAYEARTAAVGAGGGMKQSDYDRAFKEFIEDRSLQNLAEPEMAKDLADMMARLYQKTGGGRSGDAYPSIIKAVMAAYDAGPEALDEMREEYGLQ